MKKFLPLLLLLILVTQTVCAVDRITLSITVTNVPSNNDTLTVNSATRTNKTTVTAPSLEILIGASIGAQTTNLWNQIVANPYANALAPRWIATNEITLTAQTGNALTASASGTWATLTLTTQAVTSLTAVRVPIGSETASVKTNIASLLVTGINDHAQNSFDATATALANFVSLSEQQTITGNKTFDGNLNTHTNASVEMYLSNLDFFTNSVLRFYEGAYVQFDTNVWILDQYGNTNWAFTSSRDTNKVATLDDLEIFKTLDNAWTGENDFDNATGTFTNGTFYGTIGLLSGGYISSTGGTNNVFTNATTRGTFTHTSDVSFTRANNTSLANGNNAAIDFGSETVYAKIKPGPSAEFTLNGIAGGRNGRFLIVENATGQSMIVAHDSGVDPTPANRIYTATSNNVTNTANAIALFVYDSEVSRWKLANFSANAESVAGLTTNPTSGYLPYNNAGTFDDSPWYRISTNQLGFNSTNFFVLVDDRDNTAVGNGSLQSNTSGYYNTSLGHESLLLNTGSGNTAVGRFALNSVGSGSYNSGFGQNAGVNLGGASSGNTLLGWSAGGNGTSLTSTIAVGYQAGINLDNGALGNTFIGPSAGYGVINATNSIVMGIGVDSWPTNVLDSVLLNPVVNPASNGTNTVSTLNNNISIGANIRPMGDNIAQIGTNGVTVLYLNGTVGWFRGTGSPEGVVTATVGSYYSNESGGAGTSFYVKESGSGNTGWAGK